ncbi:MAG TPA: hypothetical protein VGD10_07800 [Allosphingosinicella sp.]|uniref:hypothetical protein n=1 Tax=Allosphingosinicella sp. TaxID=2823234 RepID=UPI002EDA6C4C
MRKSLSLAALLLASACGGGEPQQTRTSEDLQTFDVAEEPPAPMAPPPPAPVARSAADESGPAIAPTAAPGVAFDYRYAFRLPAERVAVVQEQHAQACEKLGLSRCRITGMRYRLVNERDIEAMLAFKLDPTIARQFGKAGVETVTQAEGMLVDSEISGVDAGAEIKRANRTDAQLNEDLRRMEEQLARPGIRSDERARLQSEAQQLRNMIRANQATREDQEESLATTPMVFQYGSGDLVPGFDARSPIRNAIEQAGDNFVSGFAAMLVILATLLPWALLLLLAAWLVQRFGRRFVAKRAETES